MGIDLIVAALTGVVTGIAEGTVSEPAKKAYQDLKALIQHELANKPKAQQVLADGEQAYTLC